MKEIAGDFGKKVLREINKEDVLSKINELREKYGDRAVLRALHFFDENENVDLLVKALKANDFNVYANINPKEQGISLALYVAEGILKNKGSYRVHGGGFGGTTQNFVPLDMADEFKRETEKIFGEGKCHILNIRKYGGIKVF